MGLGEIWAAIKVLPSLLQEMRALRELLQSANIAYHNKKLDEISERLNTTSRLLEQSKDRDEILDINARRHGGK